MQNLSTATGDGDGRVCRTTSSCQLSKYASPVVLMVVDKRRPEIVRGRAAAASEISAIRFFRSIESEAEHAEKIRILVHADVLSLKHLSYAVTAMARKYCI